MQSQQMNDNALGGKNEYKNEDYRKDGIVVYNRYMFSVCGIKKCRG